MMIRWQCSMALKSVSVGVRTTTHTRSTAAPREITTGACTRLPLSVRSDLGRLRARSGGGGVEGSGDQRLQLICLRARHLGHLLLIQRGVRS